jgi:hypothetical protein
LVFVSIFSFLGGIVGGVISVGNFGFAGEKSAPYKEQKVNYLESEEIYANKIKVKNLFIENSDGSIVAVLDSFLDGQPRFKLYNAKYPYGARIPKGKDKMSNKEFAEWLKNSKETEPVFGITIFDKGPHMWFADKDFDERISVAIADSDSYIAFRSNNKEKIAMGISDPDPYMYFRDRDFDERFSVKINGLDPYMTFRYNNKTRLQLGTNELMTKATGTEQKIKGSICAFDNKGKVIGSLP